MVHFDFQPGTDFAEREREHITMFHTEQPVRKLRDLQGPSLHSTFPLEVAPMSLPSPPLSLCLRGGRDSCCNVTHSPLTGLAQAQAHASPSLGRKQDSSSSVTQAKVFKPKVIYYKD